MFTGIVEEVGLIRRITHSANGARLMVAAHSVTQDAQLGDSIAVNGVCLTVVEKSADSFAADLSAETLKRTSLKQAVVGTRVNLERALLPTTRLGGHIMQGHVDGTGHFIFAQPLGEGWTVCIGFPSELARYLVEKGSIAVDGISLTIAALGENWFEIAVIPHTWQMTNLSSLLSGAAVNLEVDIIAKYVERMMQVGKSNAGLTLERLGELGY
ncbi:MAG: riboflavin synthase [Acidobacteria bacterium]|nr:riboflavin synthase [Acidobacteriota bacterium]